MIGFRLRKHRLPKLLPYGGGKPLGILGSCDVTIESKFAIQCHHFYVVNGAHGSLIGFNTTQELGLANIVSKINSEWEEEYPGLPKGVGKLKIAITNRKIPFHMRPKTDEEEQRLLSEDTIDRTEPVGEPTPGVSSIVTPPKKDGSIRVCIAPDKARTPQHAEARRTHT